MPFVLDEYVFEVACDLPTNNAVGSENSTNDSLSSSPTTADNNDLIQEQRPGTSSVLKQESDTDGSKEPGGL